MDNKQSNVQLEFGLHDNLVLNVHDLSFDERGKACNCVCPGCGKPLIAKMGSKNQWHFAHDGDACNIAAAQQTALHMDNYLNMGTVWFINPIFGHRLVHYRQKSS